MRCAGIHIDATRSHYPTSQGGIERAGLVVAEEDEKPPFVWVDGILTKDRALEHAPWQRFNKIPGMDFVCYKSTFFKAMNEMRKNFPHQFEIYPKTFQIPREFLEFQREHIKVVGKGSVAPSWVVKPKNGCCGKGIAIVQSVAEVQDIDYDSVVQLYVHPFLLNGLKFDFRFYIFIASLEPLTVFVYKEGIARFCTQPYEEPSKSNRDKKFMHITNTAINIENSDEPPSAFTKKASEVLNDISKQRLDGKFLWDKICEVCRAVVIGLYPTIINTIPKEMEVRTAKPKKDLFSTKKPNKDRKLLVDEINELQNPFPQSTTINPPSVRNHKPQPQIPAISSSIKVDVVRKQMNMMLLPNKQKQAVLTTNPIVVGSIVNYQISPSQNNYALAIKKRFNMSAARRSLSLSPPRDHRTTALPHLEKLDDLPEPIDPSQLVEMPSVAEESDTAADQKPAEEVVNKEEEDKPEPKPVPIKKRYWHICGIDIMIDRDLNPQVLELNDRPSLGVTVDFEKELKEKFIADSFEHESPTGEVFGECPHSDWQKIFPMPRDHPNYQIWRDILYRIMNPDNRYNEIQRQPPPQTPTRKSIEIRQSTRHEKRKRTKKHSKNQ